MNCSIFRSKVNELIEDDCLVDLKKSMEEHKDNCENCKAYYEKELEINIEFKQFFNVSNIEFKSSRVDIMKAINKNQYKNNYLIQTFTHVNKHKKKYFTWAAVFIMILLVIPNLKFPGAMKSSSIATKGVSNSYSIAKDDNTASENSVKDSKNITFKKIELVKGEEIVPQGIWKNTTDGKYSACIDGKTTSIGFSARDIYVKENDTGLLWSFTINNDLNQQNTPILVEWSQKHEDLMVTIEKATGTTSAVKDSYMLNLDSAIASLINNTSK